MTVETVEAFKARDGKLFETAEEANKQNLWLDVLDHLRKSPVVSGPALTYKVFSSTHACMLASVRDARFLTTEDVIQATEQVPRFVQRCAQELKIDMVEFKRRVKDKEITLLELLIAFAG